MNFVRLRFTQSSDVDVLHGGNTIVRHTPNTGNSATFTNAIDIIPALAGNISETLVPALSGTYLIKFKDDSGHLSSGSAKIAYTDIDSQPKLVILTQREDTDSPPFQGTKVNTFYDSTLDGLLLQGTTLLDDIADFDNISNFDFAGHSDITTGPISPTGSYEFQNVIDLGAKFNLTLKRRIVSSGILVNTAFDTRTANVDTWTDFEGLKNEDVNAKLLVATTDDNPSSGSPTFTQFNTFANGQFSARGFKFKCELTSNDPAQNINISELGFEASLERRVETVNTSIASGTSAKTVTFTHPFFTGTSSLGGSTSAYLPTVSIELENALFFDSFQITSITGTQFVIEVRDGSNNFKNLNFKYTAVGFGRGS